MAYFQLAIGSKQGCCFSAWRDMKQFPVSCHSGNRHILIHHDVLRNKCKGAHTSCTNGKNCCLLWEIVLLMILSTVHLLWPPADCQIGQVCWILFLIQDMVGVYYIVYCWTVVARKGFWAVLIFVFPRIWTFVVIIILFCHISELNMI